MSEQRHYCPDCRPTCPGRRTRIFWLVVGLACTPAAVLGIAQQLL